MKVQIGYGQIDPSAKPDSTPQSNDVQPWTDLNDLKLDRVTIKNVATLERNYAVLDGEQEHLPDNAEEYQWGFWSASMSDENGKFTHPPVLDIQFSFNHKSPGLSLSFYPYSDDYASKIRATWYSGQGDIIHTGEYDIDSVEGYIAQNINDFRRIQLEFLETNKPNRYVKFSGISYGFGRSFADEDIDTVTILEEIDPTSNEISINTLNFRIRTNNPEFSMVSGIGDNMLMHYQQMSIVADKRDFGLYFLQFPWKDVYGDGSVVDFQAVDAIGVMDNYQFWGDVYHNIPIETLLDQIFNVCFPTKLVRYELDDTFKGKTLSGWIPINTCRHALQLICFAIGAVADDSRRDYIWIYPPDTELTSTIPNEKIYRSPEITPTTYYSGVEVVAYEYIPGEDSIDAFSGELKAGQNVVRFAEPLHSLSIAGGSIIESTANHAVLNIPSDGEYTLAGLRYTVNQPVFQELEEVSAGEVENIKIYQNCTMLAPEDGPALAAHLFAYLKQRAQFSGDIRLDMNEPGYMVEVSTVGNPIKGTIEQLDIDLRGDRAKVKVIGSVDDPRYRQNP